MGTLFGAHPIVPCPVFRSPDIPLGYLGPENEDANYNEKNSNLMITTKKKKLSIWQGCRFGPESSRQTL